MARSFSRNALIATAWLLACGGSWAQPSGVARVTNQVWGYYYADTTLDISIGGNSLGTYSTTQWFIKQYNINAGTSAASVPAGVSISATSSGNPVTSPSTVTMDFRAGTTWGANHTYASISGFDPYSTTTSTVLCTTLPGSGTCLPGFPEQTQTLTSNNSAYGYSTSRWEEIYQTAGGAGALSTTFNVHVTLGPQSSGSGTPSGTSQFYWAERDFSGTTVASFSAIYFADIDRWSATTFSNLSGESHSFSGMGTFTIGDLSNPVVLTADDGSGATFDGTITGLRSFATGDVVYVDSFAQSAIGGNGLSDAGATVTLVNLTLPTGVRVLATSGADYGGVVTGGGGGGGLCTSSACLGSGGGDGGGTLPSVPEPETYALFAAGLAVVGYAARRRRPD